MYAMISVIWYLSINARIFANHHLSKQLFWPCMIELAKCHNQMLRCILAIYVVVVWHFLLCSSFAVFVPCFFTGTGYMLLFAISVCW
jgi:hypothetical protein